MKAAVLIEKEHLEIQNRSASKPVGNEVLVRVHACGICGTDLHIFHGQPGSADVVPPRILGHELAGEVVETGPDDTSFRKGDRVSIDPNMYCGTCRYCRDGRHHLCTNLRAIGVTQDGGLAEYCLVPETNCFLVPDSVTFEEAALAEPLGCCLHGVEQLNLSRSYSALIIGGGFIGVLMVQVLKMLGVSHVIVSEYNENKHDLIKKSGADEVVLPNDLEKTSTEHEFDVVVECVGRTETMQSAIHYAAKGGQILLFGVADPATVINVNPFEIFSRELTIHGSFINPFTHERALKLIESKKVDVHPLISHRHVLDEVPDLIMNYRSYNITKSIVGI